MKEHIFGGLVCGLQQHEDKLQQLDDEISHLNFVKECRIVAKSTLGSYFDWIDTGLELINLPSEIYDYVKSHVESFDELKKLFAEYGLKTIAEEMALSLYLYLDTDIAINVIRES